MSTPPPTRTDTHGADSGEASSSAAPPPPQRHDEELVTPAWRRGVSRSSAGTASNSRELLISHSNMRAATATTTAAAAYQPASFYHGSSSNSFAFPTMTTPYLARETSNSSSSSSGGHKPLLLPRILPRPYMNDNNSTQTKLRPLTAYPGTAAARPVSPTDPSVATTAVDPALSLMTLLQRAQQEVLGHKRSFSSGDEEEGGEEDSSRDHNSQTWTPERTHKKAKGRKPTYLVRKEEKDLLIDEVSKLQAQVDFLRERSGIIDWQNKDKQLQQKEIVNNMMRETVRNQQFSFFSAQSVVSELMSGGTQRCPIDTYIHLGKDWAKRRETLVALKAQKLHDAQRLLEKRTQFMDPTRELSEDSSFVTETGDYCTINFQSIPLKGAKCVKQVYDALQFHTQNMERSISEAMGTVLTSDGDDNWDKTILHRRLVHSNVRDVLTESNFVVFSEFYDDRKKDQWSKDTRGSNSNSGEGIVGKQLGVIVLDFVDEDELYPYRTRQCVRRDVTGVITLRAVPCKPKCVDNGAGGMKQSQQQEYAVVITKWIMLKLHHNSAIAIPDLKMQELKSRISEISNALVRAVQESTVFPVQASTSTNGQGISNSSASNNSSSAVQAAIP